MAVPADPARQPESSDWWLAFLARANSELAGSLDYRETFRHVADLVVPEVADACALELVGEDGLPMEVALTHVDPTVVDSWRSVLGRFYASSPRLGPRRLVLSTRRAHVIETTDEYWDDVAADADHAGQLRTLGVTWILALPLIARDRVLGIMTMVQTTGSGRRFTHHDVPVCEELARRAALAVDNALLYRAEQEARAASEQARRRLAVLAEASKSLAASLDFDLTLQNVARIIVPTIADHVVIDLVSDDGSVRRVASVGVPAQSEVAEGLLRHGPRRIEDTHFVADVIRSGQSIYVPETVYNPQPSGIAPGAHADLVQQLGATSVVLAPLAGHTGILGVLSVTTTTASKRRLTQEDVDLITELAQRAAVAVEHARLYSRQRDVALTLQRSLLPPSLPVIPGIGSAARYLPGAVGTEVGGDWYDLIPLPGGTVAAAMGDVEGRGTAAAARMGQLRNAMLAYAVDSHPPADVLRRLDRLLVGHGPGGLATLLLAVLDPETGRLRISSAGHPPPLVLEPGAPPVFLELDAGAPLGAIPFARFSETEATLAPGATLLLYTDGVFERRGEPIDVGLERLRQAAATGPHDLDAFVDHVLAATAGDQSIDDAAILVLRLEALGAELVLRLPAEPEVLAGLRSTLRRWLREIAGATDVEIAEIVLACGEACANAIEHAYGPAPAEFEVIAALDESGVRIVVRDRGRWRQPAGESAGTDASRGKGRAVMEAYMDVVETRVDDRGTEVVLGRKLGGTDGPGT